MRQLKDIIRDREVRHIVMPGTHNSGMSTISGKIMGGGIDANTQNQGNNILEQLRIGDDYEFYVAHVPDEMTESLTGNTGQPLYDILDEINMFTSENPGEVIFLRFKYLVGFTLTSGGHSWGNDIHGGVLGEFIYRLRIGLDSLRANLDTKVPFEQQNIGNFLDRNGGAGCVIPLLAGRLDKDTEAPGYGIYSAKHINIWDN
ncbi:hypothetical protein N0V88_005968 [Collariella sp. IMI 366227]|nr:hypothetical protein N0V88_005968 [Collariella sp. IMI 366227]